MEQIEEKKHAFSNFYDKHYKTILILPVALLLFSLIYLAVFVSQTGDIVRKDVSLTGGTTLTLYTEKQISSGIESTLKSKFSDISVRTLADMTTGKQLALTIETKADSEELKNEVQKYVGYELDNSNSSIEFTGASLSKSFYKELIFAIILAFIFMTIVVFFLFKMFLPSFYVVLCAFTDIIVPLAIINMAGITVSTAGIAAFLMLIGYSVDTDILLTTRCLKRREEDLNKRIYNSFKTGITMTITSLVAVLVAYFIVFSPVLKEVFLILSIGLCVDIIGTWLMSASLVKWYCEIRGLK